MPEIKTFQVEDAEIIYRNFTGNPGPYNKEGERDFGVILDERVAKEMERDGWAVKYPKQRDEEEENERRPFIKVKVGYKIRPPKVVLITENSRTNLTEETIGVLDWADILLVDLIAQSSYWTFGEKSGIAAYLKTMFVTIQEDALERKYAIMEDQ